jgi:hypothetical protein
MWYPSQQQQQQHSWYEYAHHVSSQQQQQQQMYSKPSYYCNGDDLSTTCVIGINDENESSVHCQTTYGGNIHGKEKIQLKFERIIFLFEHFCFIHEYKTINLYEYYKFYFIFGFHYFQNGIIEKKE